MTARIAPPAGEVVGAGAAGGDLVSDGILTFRLAERRLALPLANVREVLRAVAITPLPGAPSVVEGIIRIRGDLVPVLDLRARLGLPSRPVDLDNRLIVIETGRRTLVLRVDGVDSLQELPANGVEDAPDSIRPAGFIAGIVALAEGLTLIHDVERFLSSVEEGELAEAERRFDPVEEAGAG